MNRCILRTIAIEVVIIPMVIKVMMLKTVVVATVILILVTVPVTTITTGYIDVYIYIYPYLCVFIDSHHEVILSGAPPSPAVLLEALIPTQGLTVSPQYLPWAILYYTEYGI